MAKRRFTLPGDVRKELESALDGAAARLIADQNLDREDAAELLAHVVGEVVELLVEGAGAPDAIGDAVGAFAERLVAKVGDVLKPDPSKLMDRAKAALKAGEEKKAARLFKKARTVYARQQAKA